ncbi:MAG: hypothetical protein KDH96_13700, partial [Candidatus Riesia sp.]|nr:hypothetical protein [Candidatus Riesia sp.]
NELRLKELHLLMDDKLKAQKELLTKEIEGKAPKSEFNTIYKLVWGVVTLIVFGVANELFNLV